MIIYVHRLDTSLPVSKPNCTTQGLFSFYFVGLNIFMSVNLTRSKWRDLNVNILSNGFSPCNKSQEKLFYTAMVGNKYANNLAVKVTKNVLVAALNYACHYWCCFLKMTFKEGWSKYSYPWKEWVIPINCSMPEFNHFKI